MVREISLEELEAREAQRQAENDAFWKRLQPKEPAKPKATPRPAQQRERPQRVQRPRPASPAAPRVEPPPNMYSIAELSLRWGVSHGKLAHWCRKGRFPGAQLLATGKTGRKWFIPRDAVKPERTATTLANLEHCAQVPTGMVPLREFVGPWGISPITLQDWCRKGRVPGARKLMLPGHTAPAWFIPAGTQRPASMRSRPGPEERPDGMMSITEMATIWGVSHSLVSRWCGEGRIPGAGKFQTGGGTREKWFIPQDAVMPPHRTRGGRT